MLPVGRAPWIARAIAACAVTVVAAQAQAQADVRLAQVPAAAATVAEPQNQTQPKVPHGADVVAPQAGAAAVDHHRPPHKPTGTASSDCVSGAQFDAFKSELNATWSLSKGKDDSAQLKDFPAAPDFGSALEIWAANIAGNLRGVLYPRLTSGQQQEFSALENQNCPSGRVYCQIAFRQKAVFMLLPEK